MIKVRKSSLMDEIESGGLKILVAKNKARLRDYFLRMRGWREKWIKRDYSPKEAYII